MVRRSFKWYLRARESLKSISQIPSRRVENSDVVEAGTGRRRGLSAFTLLCIKPDMVVIAAGGKEYRVLSISLSYLEAEDSLIER